MIQALRIKLDPESKARNRRKFMDAQKIPDESMTAFIDRCRTFIKRSGADPREKLIDELLKRKVLENVEISDRKILQAAIQPTEDLDKIVRRADSMSIAGFENGRLEPESKILDSHEDTQGQLRSSIGPCGKCHKKGHTRKYCPIRLGTQATREQELSQYKSS